MADPDAGRFKCPSRAAWPLRREPCDLTDAFPSPPHPITPLPLSLQHGGISERNSLLDGWLDLGGGCGEPCGAKQPGPLALFPPNAHLGSALTSCLLSRPDRSAAVHPFAYRGPVHQPGLQLARALWQLQQRHLLPQPLQRVGGLGDGAPCRGAPLPPTASARHPAQLHLQQLGRADPQGEQDPAPLQRVREEQPPQARAAAPQPLHPTADGPPGPAAQTPPAAHGQHEAGGELGPSGPQTEASAQESVPAIGAGSGPRLELEETLAYFALLYWALPSFPFFFFFF